ncbi:cellular retinoic acid-binding protein 2 [Oncorhynchus mykiss]|uniref:Cellular retinoic acid binding protein 2, b n=2 Tax=Oncorhynchus mykiss TaxID=8022 RepID=A0A8C7UIC2_ONCMY|nr:cellular retinoic acid-binding protein 2 [Oncorhynchus mykiss]
MREREEAEGANREHQATVPNLRDKTQKNQKSCKQFILWVCREQNNHVDYLFSVMSDYYNKLFTPEMDRRVANFSGLWKMKTSENFEELLKALGVNVFVRKIAVAAASRPAVEITQQGESLSIQTSTSVRTTHVSFTVGQPFNEDTVDGRPCTSTPRWETDSKISCEQTLQKGEGPKTAWTREVTNDGELILTMSAGDVVCTRVYQRE